MATPPGLPLDARDLLAEAQEAVRSSRAQVTGRPQAEITDDPELAAAQSRDTVTAARRRVRSIAAPSPSASGEPGGGTAGDIETPPDDVHTKFARFEQLRAQRATPPEPVPTEDTWARLGTRLLERAGPLTMKWLGGAAQLAEEYEPSPSMPAELAGLGWTEEQWQAATQPRRDELKAKREAGTILGQEIYSSAVKDLADNAPQFGDNVRKQYAFEISESIVQMIPVIVASLVGTPAAGATLVSAQVGGSQYGESRDKGRTPEQAAGDAVVKALAEGIPETVPLGILVKRGGSFLARVFKAAGAEAIQETMTEAINMGYDAGVLDEKTPWGEVIPRLVHAGLIGAGAGAGLAVVTHPSVREPGAAQQAPPPAPPPVSPPSPTSGAVPGAPPPTAAPAQAGQPPPAAPAAPSPPPPPVATGPARSAKDLKAAVKRVKDGAEEAVLLTADELLANDDLATKTPKGMVRLPNFDENGGHLLVRAESAAPILSDLEQGVRPVEILRRVMAPKPPPAAPAPAPPVAAAPPATPEPLGPPPPVDVPDVDAYPNAPVPEATDLLEEARARAPVRKVPREPIDDDTLPPLERLPKLPEPDFVGADVTRSVKADPDAFRSFLGFLAGKVEDQQLSRGLEMARTRLTSPDIQEALAEPINTALQALPEATRRAAVNAIRNGDGKALREIVAGRAAPTAPPPRVPAETPAQKEAPAPAAAKALETATAVPKGKRRPGTLRERAMALQGAAVAAEAEATTDVGRLKAAKIRKRLEAVMAKSDRAWQKGTATTHKDLDKMGDELKAALEATTEARAEPAPTPDRAPAAKSESRSEPAPAKKPKKEPIHGKETVVVKPKLIRGRQVQSLLKGLGLEGEGRGALDQLRALVPSLNRETTRIFALVPTWDQAKQVWKEGAIPVKEWQSIMRSVNAYTTAENEALAQEALVEKLGDVGGKRLDDATQMEIIELATRLRELEQSREPAVDPLEDVVDELEREIIQETTQTDADAEGLLNLEGVTANMQPQMTDTRSAAFQRWFKGSKVTEVQYHGTMATEDFDTFTFAPDLGFHFGTRSAAHGRIDERATTLSSDLRPRVLPVWLSIKNPLTVPDMGGWDPRKMIQWLYENGHISEVRRDALLAADASISAAAPFGAQYRETMTKRSALVRDAIEGLGYDGVVYKNMSEDAGSTSWIAFRPEQIKSVFATEFSPRSPSISNLTPEQQEAVDEGMDWLESVSGLTLTEIFEDRLADAQEIALLHQVADAMDLPGLVASREPGLAENLPTFQELAPRILQAIKQVETSRPELATRAKRLGAVVQALLKLTAETPISVARGGRGQGTAHSGDMVAGGVPFGASVVLTPADTGRGEALFTLLHEVAHMATALHIVNNPNSEAVKALRELATQVYGLYKEHGGVELFRHNAWTGLENGDLTEFVVEVMTNPTFLREVAKLDPAYQRKYHTPKTIIGRFVEIITRLLGLSAEHTPLVADLTHAAWSVAAEQKGSPRLQNFLRERRTIQARRVASRRERPPASRRVAAVVGPVTSRMTADFDAKSAATRQGSRLWASAREAFLALHTMDQIERRHAPAFQVGAANSLKDLIGIFRQRRAAATRMQEKAEKEWAQDWLRLPAAANEQLGNVARDMTLWGIDPRAPADNQTTEAKERPSFEADYDRIKRAWDALPRESRQILTRAMNYFQEMRQEARAAGIDLAVDLVQQHSSVKVTPARRRLLYGLRSTLRLPELIGDGKAIDLGNDTLNDELRKSVGRILRITDIAGPYLPLRRYGDFVVTANEDVNETFDDFETAEAALDQLLESGPANEGSLVGIGNKWRLVGTRLYMSLHHSRNEADAAKAELGRQGVVAQVGKKLDANSEQSTGLVQLMSAIQRRLPGNPEARKLIENAFLELMADRAVHASKLRRVGYMGVKGEEMRRAAAERAVGSSWNLVDLRTTVAESDALNRMRQDVTAPGVDDDVRIRRGEVANEVTRLRASNLTSRMGNAWEAAIGTIGMLKFLLDPAYAVVNATQTALVAYPVMAARFGQGRTLTAMGRAYRAVTGPVMRKSLAGLARPTSGTTRYDILAATMAALKQSPRYAKYLPQLQEMIDNNVIDATFAQELAATARGTAGGTRWQLALEYMKLLPQGAEYLNRFVTALSALELTGGNVARASDMVRLTQFDYTTENRPRAFRFPGARAILMFKMYSQGMTNILVSSFYDAMRSSGVKRGVALKTLGGVVASHAMLAGITGAMIEPLRAIVWAVAHATADDEEQVPPVDTLVAMWTADLLGQKWGEVLARGLPSAIGMDLVNRVGIHNLILFDKDNSPLTPEGLVSLLGPMPQAVFQVKRGIEHMSEGRYAQGLSMLLPKWFADWARAYNMLTKGVTTAGGDVRVPAEEVSGWDVAQQAIGFRPRSETRDVELRRAEAQRNDWLSAKKQSLYRRFRQATPGERKVLMAEVRAFNKANPGTPVRYQDLIRAVTGYKEQILESRRGVTADRSLRDQTSPIRR